MLTLKAEARTAKDAAAVRAAGLIPAVFYGRKEKSTPISINAKEFDKIHASVGETTIFSLAGSWGTHDVLVHEVTRHPVNDTVQHVDFYVLEADRKLTREVPLNFVGVSGAVKDLGGTLIKVLYELSIEALPKDLPSSLDVDIAALATLESKILAKDVVLPKGVTLAENPNEVVANVAEYKEEVEAPVMDITQIEVEKKGKVEEEGAAADGAAAPAAAPEKKK